MPVKTAAVSKPKRIKMAPLELPAQDARVQLKRFAIIGIAGAITGLAVLWFLGAIGVAFGARALVLSYNKHNATRKDTLAYRALAIAATVVGLFDILGGIALMA